LAVDEWQRTADPDIYAVGDAVETVQLVTGRPARIPLAGPANKQGRVAGANAAGGDARFPGAVGTAIVECLGITAAKTGLSEREAATEGLACSVTWVHPLDHAGYYPGATPLHLKLISERSSGRLLGAQVVGAHGVDKRIDVLATALQARLGVDDLENLDLAYAPQFSAAKDPVVMAGFAAANAGRGEVATVTWAALLRDRPDYQLVDVRTERERAVGYLPGSVHIPLDELRDRLAELNRLRDTVVYCQAGQRGYFAARLLRQRGFERVRNVTGGILSCPASAIVTASRPGPSPRADTRP
jgi:rhodanese-related sulfurtransferase